MLLQLPVSPCTAILAAMRERDASTCARSDQAHALTPVFHDAAEPSDLTPVFHGAGGMVTVAAIMMWSEGSSGFGNGPFTASRCGSASTSTQGLTLGVVRANE